MHSYNYTGPSMNPTLRAGDCLKVVPYEDGKIRVGDVIVFHPPGHRRCVVHRVVSVSSQGIRTGGDNNNNVDPWILSPDHIAGRVVSAQRRDRNLKIYGGLWGKMFTPVRRTKRRIGLAISRILHPVYHWLARSGIFRKVLSHRFRTQILCFQRSNGVEMQLLMCRRVIGRRLPGRGWQIKRPFRLFVNESSLPETGPFHRG